MTRLAQWFLLILTLSPLAAVAAGGGDGIKLEMALGLPTLAIQNPDGSTANYSGYGAYGKALVPVIAADKFRADVSGSLRFVDFSNTANSGQNEYAQYLGPGAGLEFTYGNIFLGADYYLLKGRHNSVGPFSKRVEFNISGLNYYGGLKFNIGAGSIGLAYSQMSSAIPASAVGLSKDSPWSQSTIWLRFTYDLKISFGQFFGSIFGK